MIVSASERDLVGPVVLFEEMGWTFAENSSDLFSETMDLGAVFLRDTAPCAEAGSSYLHLIAVIKEKTKARRNEGTRPVKAFPGDILFFIRAPSPCGGSAQTRGSAKPRRLWLTPPEQ